VNFLTKRKNMFKTILLIFLFSSLHTFSQVTQDWVSRYNGSANNLDNPHSIAVDGSGNVYVSGLSMGSGTGKDYATIKYNSTGVQQWVAIYNGVSNSDDIAYSIGLDGAGNVYVTGYSWANGQSYDYATVKYNSSGVQQWVQRYDAGGGYDYAYSIAVDAAGNSYVTGESVETGTFDYATIKYNASGVQLWVMRYNGTQNGSDRANSIAVDGSGNVYVTGRSQWSGNDYDIVTLKFNTSGIQQWGQLYNGAANDWDEGLSIAVDGSGNVYVTGYSISSGTFSDYATIKYNSSGVQQWDARYSGTGNNSDRAYSIAVDGSSNVYVTGRSYGVGTNWDYGTVKYNSSGVQQWVGRYDGPGGDVDIAYSIAVDGSGNVYVTGNSDAIINTDYATVKYNSAGAEQWAARYNGPGNLGDQANSIALDGSGNVYVTGASEGTGTSDDFATIKYSQPIGIKPISTEIPNGYKLLQNYPNPFNPTTKIRFALPKSSFAKLVIYDELGRVTETIVNEQLNAGTYEVNWNAGKFSSGVYYYKLTADASASLSKGFSETKKLILIK
jgi:uncharacterized delta-60 repeat protein